MSGSPQASRDEQAGRLPGTMDREGPSDPIDYFNPQYEEFTSRRMWSLSNAQFTDEVFSSDA